MTGFGRAAAISGGPAITGTGYVIRVIRRRTTGGSNVRLLPLAQQETVSLPTFDR
jgi:hypothetical protein